MWDDVVDLSGVDEALVIGSKEREDETACVVSSGTVVGVLDDELSVSIWCSTLKGAVCPWVDGVTGLTEVEDVSIGVASPG